jgi:lipopolysaccharide export system permease protein
VLLGGAMFTGLMVFFNDQILPRANHRLSNLQRDIAATKPTFALKEGMINEVVKGKLAIRAQHIDRGTNRMHDVMILDYQDPGSRRTIYADSGDIALTEDQRDLQLLLYSGNIQIVTARQPTQLQQLFFRTNRVKVEGVGNTLQRSETEGGHKGDRERTICDMQAELVSAELEYRWTVRQLEEALVSSVHEMMTGVERESPKLEYDPKPALSLGQLYCMATGSADGEVEADTTGSGRNPYINRTSAMRERFRAAQSGMNDLPVDSRIDALRNTAITRLNDRNAFDVEIQKKFSIAVACVVFILIGAPVALRFPRGGVGLVLGVSLSVFALYYVGLIAGEDLADKNIVPPVVAMWGTNVMLTIIGAFLLVRMGKESSTARGGDMGEFLDTARAWLAKGLRRVGIHVDRRRRGA